LTTGYFCRILFHNNCRIYRKKAKIKEFEDFSQADVKMKSNIKYFNSEEAAKILGVNVSTIKRWTDSGMIECIKTAGGHRKFLMAHLSNFVERNKKQNSKVNLFTMESERDVELSYRILKGDFQYLNKYVLQEALQSNRDNIQQVLNGLYLGQYPLHQIYDLIVTPVLHQIGYLWEEGNLSIIDEHLASQVIRDSITRLQGIIRIPAEKLGNALALTPSKELHDIPLKMVDHILEARGFRVFYSGQRTPFEQIEDTIDKFKPDRIYVSSTSLEERQALQEEIDHLYRIARQKGCRVYVGGRAFDVIDFSHPVVERRLYTFEEVYKY
jgi:MerR family transcriptional regulator, light-induced transcriptional regulator